MRASILTGPYTFVVWCWDELTAHSYSLLLIAGIKNRVLDCLHINFGKNRLLI